MFHRYRTLEGALPPGLDTSKPSAPRPFFLPIDLVSTASGVGRTRSSTPPPIPTPAQSWPAIGLLVI